MPLIYAFICFSFIGSFLVIAFCHASAAADDASDKLIDQIAHGDSAQLPSGFKTPHASEIVRE